MKRMARCHRRRRSPRVHRVALRSRSAYPPASARVSCLARLRRGSKPPPRRDPKRRRSVSTAALRRARVRDASPARPLRICTFRLARDGGGRLIAATGVPFLRPLPIAVLAQPHAVRQKRRLRKASSPSLPRPGASLISFPWAPGVKEKISSPREAARQARSAARPPFALREREVLASMKLGPHARFDSCLEPRLFTTPLPGYSLTHPLQLYLTLLVSDRLRCGSGVYLGAADP